MKFNISILHKIWRRLFMYDKMITTMGCGCKNQSKRKIACCLSCIVFPSNPTMLPQALPSSYRVLYFIKHDDFLCGPTKSIIEISSFVLRRLDSEIMQLWETIGNYNIAPCIFHGIALPERQPQLRRCQNKNTSHADSWTEWLMESFLIRTPWTSPKYYLSTLLCGLKPVKA